MTFAAIQKPLIQRVRVLGMDKWSMDQLMEPHYLLRDVWPFRIKIPGKGHKK